MTRSPLTIETGMSNTSGNNRMSGTVTCATNAAVVDSLAATLPSDDADFVLLGGRPRAAH